MSQSDNGPNILFIQPGGLGDLVLTIPLLKEARDKLNGSMLGIMGRMDYLKLLHRRTCVDNIYSLDVYPIYMLFAEKIQTNVTHLEPLIRIFKACDILFTFLVDDKGRFEDNLFTLLNTSIPVFKFKLRPPQDWPFHVSAYFISQFESQAREPGLLSGELNFRTPEISMSEDDRATGQKMFSEFLNDAKGQRIIIHPGAGGEEKRWSEECYMSLAAQLESRGKHVVFLIGPVEEERLKCIDTLKSNFHVASSLHAEKSASLIAAADLYIGNDAGMTHVAGVLGIPTIAIFGPTNPVHWRPLGKNVRIITPPKGEKFPNLEIVSDMVFSMLLEKV